MRGDDGGALDQKQCMAMIGHREYYHHQLNFPHPCTAPETMDRTLCDTDGPAVKVIPFRDRSRLFPSLTMQCLHYRDLPFSSGQSK